MISFGEWDCRVANNYDLRTFDIYFWRRVPGGAIEYLKSDGTIGKMKREGISTGETHFARLEYEQGYALADSFRQMKLPGAVEQIAGELEATKFHLDDMRKLVFKDKKNG